MPLLLACLGVHLLRSFHFQGMPQNFLNILTFHKICFLFTTLFFQNGRFASPLRTVRVSRCCTIFAGALFTQPPFGRGGRASSLFPPFHWTRASKFSASCPVTPHPTTLGTRRMLATREGIMTRGKSKPLFILFRVLCWAQSNLHFASSKSVETFSLHLFNVSLHAHQHTHLPHPQIVQTEASKHGQPLPS